VVHPLLSLANIEVAHLGAATEAQRALIRLTRGGELGTSPRSTVPSATLAALSFAAAPVLAPPRLPAASGLSWRYGTCAPAWVDGGVSSSPSIQAAKWSLTSSGQELCRASKPRGDSLPKATRSQAAWSSFACRLNGQEDDFAGDVPVITGSAPTSSAAPTGGAVREQQELVGLLESLAAMGLPAHCRQAVVRDGQILKVDSSGTSSDSLSTSLLSITSSSCVFTAATSPVAVAAVAGATRGSMAVLHPPSTDA